MIDLPTPVPHLEVVTSSHGVSKGLSQNGFQLVSKATLDLGKHVYVSGQWKNTDGDIARGEAQGTVGLRGDLAGFKVDVSAAEKLLTGVQQPAVKMAHVQRTAFETALKVSRDVSFVTATVSVTYSPDDLGTTGRSLYATAGLGAHVTKTTLVSGEVGRRDRVNAPNYTAYNVGVTQKVYKNVSVDVRYYDTNASILGAAYDNRVVASTRFSF